MKGMMRREVIWTGRGTAGGRLSDGPEKMNAVETIEGMFHSNE